jgi:hypothetical protein
MRVLRFIVRDVDFSQNTLRYFGSDRIRFDRVDRIASETSSATRVGVSEISLLFVSMTLFSVPNHIIHCFKIGSINSLLGCPSIRSELSSFCVPTPGLCF